MNYEYVVEYSLEHGFLRLSSAARERLKVPLLLVQVPLPSLAHASPCSWTRTTRTASATG
jgi:hypothetical protein